MREALCYRLSATSTILGERVHVEQLRVGKVLSSCIILPPMEAPARYLYPGRGKLQGRGDACDAPNHKCTFFCLMTPLLFL